LTISPSNITWLYVAIYQAFSTMLITYAFTGEGFFDSKGREYGESYLSITVFFALVFICTFYMIYQTNTFTYYSLCLIFGNILLLITFSAFCQNNLLKSIDMVKPWVGFYGNCLNSIDTLVMIFTIFDYMIKIMI